MISANYGALTLRKDCKLQARLVCRTNLIELHHFAGMATKTLCLTSVNAPQGNDVSNPPLHSWFLTKNRFSSQDVLSLKSGDTRSRMVALQYSISSFGWRTPELPLQCCCSPQPGVLTERPAIFCTERMVRIWGYWGLSKYTQIYTLKNAELCICIPLTISCISGTAEFLAPTSKAKMPVSWWDNQTF